MNQTVNKMNKDILLVVDAMSNERGVSKEVIFEAIEAALAAVAARRYPDEDAGIRVTIDRETGDYETYRYWAVVADTEEPLEFPDREIMVSQARRDMDPALDVGDVIEEQ